MILPQHPDQMSDQKLKEWIQGLVNRETPESIFLDYKQTLKIDTRSDKRELAKDVSSFANERGGVILYGIPEEKNGSGEPIPTKPVGMVPISEASQIVENVLVDTLTPTLPETRIREILWEEPSKKVVYLVWHPKSWEAPHMIHAYGEHRYYRRGNYRAVVMEENEVESRYVQRQRRRVLATEFLSETDFGEALFDSEEQMLRLVVCPAFPFADRIDFSNENWRNWLMRNDSSWKPFVRGVRLHTQFNLGEQNTMKETRLFHNGAVSFCSSDAMFERNLILANWFRTHLHNLLDLIGEFYGSAAMAGEVLFDIAFFNVKGFRFDSQTKFPSDSEKLTTDTLQFQLRTSATSLMTEDRREDFVQRSVDRLAQCFGIWDL
ncbi:MAG: helix-turn-helix domain-containing protein [Anaerolineales bacterium]